MKAQLIDIIESEVSDKLRLDKSDVMWLKVEMGMTFLDHYLGEADPLKEKLIKSKAYWNWWRAVWANRDKFLMHNTGEPKKLGFVYLQPVTGMMEEGWHRGRMIMWHQSLRFYEIFHKRNYFNGSIRPPAEVMELDNEPIFNHK